MKPEGRLFTSVELAKLFRVHRTTVTGWVRAGLLQGIRTPGGCHYRFEESEVRALLARGEDS